MCAGLSYTTYMYEKISVKPAVSLAAATAWRLATTNDTTVLMYVSVSVRNVGTVAGQEVVQVYVTDPAGLPFVPYWKRMLGFARTKTLAPAEEQTVVVPLIWSDVSMFDEDMQLRLFSGVYNISAGGASNDTPLHTSVEA